MARVLVDLRLIYDGELSIDDVLREAFLAADYQAGRVSDGSPSDQPVDAYVLRIVRER